MKRGLGIRLVAGLAVGLALTACDDGPARQPIDAAWHRQDLEAHLTRWYAIAPTPIGMMHGAFTRDWKPRPGQGVDLTTQSRLIYVMARGYEHTGDPRYLTAASQGIDFLLRYFRDTTHGGFYRQVDLDGKVVNSDKHTYGHAFALLALAHMARLTQEPRYREAALQAWQDIDRGLRDRHGGFLGETTRTFAGAADSNSQNPLMHLFEALLALVAATDDPAARAGAQKVGDFVLYKLLQGYPDGSAAIPEWYDFRWRPLATREQGAYVDLGHQFEWVHLLFDAERFGLPPLYAAAGERVLAYALKHGYDEQEGGAYNRLFPDGQTDRGKYWWPQAEAIHGLAVAAARSGNPELWRRYAQTVELVKKQIVDEKNGGWRLAVRAQCAKGDCDNEQPEPYHMVTTDMAVLGLGGRPVGAPTGAAPGSSAR